MKEASPLKDKDTDKHNEIIEILKKNFRDIKTELHTLRDAITDKIIATGDDIIEHSKSHSKFAGGGGTKHKGKKSTKRKRTFRIK